MVTNCMFKVITTKVFSLFRSFSGMICIYYIDNTNQVYDDNDKTVPVEIMRELNNIIPKLLHLV
jgi:hypothetical protein